MPYIEIVHVPSSQAPAVGHRFLLTQRPMSIGRGPARDIQILDPKVSRKHAIVRMRDTACVLTPLTSLNGIDVNGRPIAGEIELCNNDEIRLGETLCRYVSEQDAEIDDAAQRRKAAGSFASGRNTIRA